MKLRMGNGELLSNNSEIINILVKHFHTIYKRNMQVDWQFIISI